jgi:hypothetical protein
MQRAWLRLLAFIALVASTAAAPRADADVIYQQSGDSALSFTYTAPDFITGDLSLLAADLTSVAAGILSVDFLSSCPDFAPCDEIRLNRTGGIVTILGYAENAFTVVGTYPLDTLTLSVTQTQTDAVPEPATLALLGAGLLALGAARRRRSRA